MVLSILFLTFSNTNVQFVKKELTWKFYITIKVLLTTKQLELINKKEFAKMALDENSETFIIYVISFNLALISVLVYPDKEA